MGSWATPFERQLENVAFVTLVFLPLLKLFPLHEYPLCPCQHPLRAEVHPAEVQTWLEPGTAHTPGTLTAHLLGLLGRLNELKFWSM